MLGTAMMCPRCGRVASVPGWCSRPICVHAWNGSSPEVWDGDDVDGEGRRVEDSPEESFRSPGPTTWSEMVPVIMCENGSASGREDG